MYIFQILSINILYILLETTSSQYDYQNNMQNTVYRNQYQNEYFPQGYDMLDEEDDYDDEPRKYYRRSRHYRRRPYGNSGGKLPRIHYKYEESEECKCICMRCDDDDPCCKDVCTNCNEKDNPQDGQANLILVPYPYPFIVSPKVIDSQQTQTSTAATTSPDTTTTIKTTTTETASTTEENPKSSETRRFFNRNNHYSQIGAKLKQYYMLTPLRRTKPAWLPKYGIVSLPNNLTEKLISKLHDVKELRKPREHSSIDIDS